MFLVEDKKDKNPYDNIALKSEKQNPTMAKKTNELAKKIFLNFNEITKRTQNKYYYINIIITIFILIKIYYIILYCKYILFYFLLACLNC